MFEDKDKEISSADWIHNGILREFLNLDENSLIHRNRIKLMFDYPNEANDELMIELR